MGMTAFGTLEARVRLRGSAPFSLQHGAKLSLINRAIVPLFVAFLDRD